MLLVRCVGTQQGSATLQTSATACWVHASIDFTARVLGAGRLRDYVTSMNIVLEIAATAAPISGVEMASCAEMQLYHAINLKLVMVRRKNARAMSQNHLEHHVVQPRETATWKKLVMASIWTALTTPCNPSVCFVAVPLVSAMSKRSATEDLACALPMS